MSAATAEKLPDASTRPLRVVLAGNPNSGKSTLFNVLAGTSVRVGNYPGVTVDRRSATWTVGGRKVELVDLPGAYSLTARSPEEQIAADALLGHGDLGADAVLIVLDSTTLARGLYLAVQIRELGIPAVIALNMIDEARAVGIEIDVARMREALGAPVVAISASKREGIDALAEAMDGVVSAPDRTPEPMEIAYSPRVEAALAAVESAHREMGDSSWRAQPRAIAAWLLLSLGEDELEGISDDVRKAVDDARGVGLIDVGGAHGEESEVGAELIAARYERVDAIVSDAVTAPDRDQDQKTATERLDAFLTHPLWGGLAFIVTMLGLFQALFSWSEPFVGAIESLVEAAKGAVPSVLPAGPLAALVQDGIIGGVGNVIVFVPQIALLFLFITFLEDCGYLARVAFVIDRLMSGVGLHGKSFVPLLSGFACAVPAVMATRTIERRRDRLITMLALPFVSCSARLPVYVLVIATVFAGASSLPGGIAPGAVALLGMYGLSVVAALIAAAVLRRTVLTGPRPTLILELPPYRWPVPRDIARAVGSRVRTFLVDAGTIILAMSIVLWAMLYYPRDHQAIAEYEAAADAARVELSDDALDERLDELAHVRDGRLLAHSAAGRIGHAMEPVIEPLGFDWRIGVGILGAFAAREVFVSTLGIVFGVGEAEEDSVPLRQALANATHDDGRPLMTPLAGVSLMVFFVLACQCMSTLAVVRRESGSWRWPLLMFAYMTVAAYLASLLVYQVGSAMGWGLT